MIKLPLQEVQITLGDILGFIRQKYADLPKTDCDAVELVFPYDASLHQMLYFQQDVRLHFRFARLEDIKKAEQEAKFELEHNEHATQN